MSNDNNYAKRDKSLDKAIKAAEEYEKISMEIKVDVALTRTMSGKMIHYLYRKTLSRIAIPFLKMSIEANERTDKPASPKYLRKLKRLNALIEKDIEQEEVIIKTIFEYQARR